MNLPFLDIDSSDAAVIAVFREAAAVLFREANRALAGLAINLAGVFIQAATTLRRCADEMEASERDAASASSESWEKLLLDADRALEVLSSRLPGDRAKHDSYRRVLARKLDELHGRPGIERTAGRDARLDSEDRRRLSVVRPSAAPPAAEPAPALPPCRYLFVDETPLFGDEPWRFPCEELSLALEFFANRVSLYTSIRGNPGALVIIDAKNGRVLRSTLAHTAADVAGYLVEPTPESPSVTYPHPTRVQ